MKINREMVVHAGLKLLNQEGLEQLTLRRLGVDLNVQAATIYWHFKSKEELLDEMATRVLAEGAASLVLFTQVIRLESVGCDLRTWSKEDAARLPRRRTHGGGNAADQHRVHEDN